MNEERHIAGSIESVGKANEILVLDAGSTDHTAEIAASLGARVHDRPMTDFAEQRNHALSLATSDWVFHLDADERVTQPLWDEITNAISAGESDGFLVPTRNHVFGAPLQHGGWYPQYHLRLHRRTKGQWSREVMEFIQIEGPVGKLSEPIEHFGHPDIRTFVLKADFYTTMEAERLQRPVFQLAALAILYPIPYFAYKYVFQRGFLDGWRGLVIAMLLSFYRCLTYLKAIERVARAAERPRAGG